MSPKSIQKKKKMSCNRHCHLTLSFTQETVHKRVNLKYYLELTTVFVLYRKEHKFHIENEISIKKTYVLSKISKVSIFSPMNLSTFRYV